MSRPPEVSVVVPVHNPGDHVDDLLRSLDAQTLARDAWEVLLVDDGSTDGTGARLDAWAAGRPFAHVRHIPNSGWPGTPRNVGLEAARGAYVLFADNDDWLDGEALERLLRRATDDDADVVVGRTVGHGKRVPRALFRADRREVGLDWEPLLRLLTPHKLFRRALLDEHGIRFPAGRIRLEDHLFVVHAYLHARRISVLADHPIYHWVHRPGHNASSAFDPAGYFRDLRRVLDLVDEHVEAGDLRDHLHAHWYRSKVLRRAGGANLLDRPPEHRAAQHRELVTVVAERFPPRLDARLWFASRVRAALLRAGSLDDLLAFARLERDAVAEVAFEGARPDGPDAVVRVRARLRAGDGPLRLRPDGERLVWVPPPALAPALAGVDLDVATDPQRDWLEVLARDLGDRTERALPAQRATTLEPVGDGLVTPVLRAQVRVSATARPALPASGHVVLVLPRIAGFTPPLVVLQGPAGHVRLDSDGRTVRVADPWRHRLAARAPRAVAGVRGVAARLRRSDARR